MWERGQVVELIAGACTCAAGSKAVVIGTSVYEGVDLLEVEWIRPLKMVVEFEDMNNGISEQQDGGYPVDYFKLIEKLNRFDLILTK